MFFRRKNPSPIGRGEDFSSWFCEAKTPKYEEIQKERDQVIGATQEDIRGLRDMIASVLAENNLCVVGNEETLQASEGMFGEVKHLNESER